MDWNLVKIYLAIYRKGTISKAAASLKMSESTLFRRLGEYERVTGKLFNRHNGEYQLSRLGHDLLAPALAAEKHLTAVDKCIRNYQSPSKTTIKITAPTSFSYWHLPPILSQLQNKLGHITIELETSNLPLNLDIEQADIALRVTDKPPINYIGKKIATLNWGAYASEQYLKEQPKYPENIEQLAGINIISPAGELLSSTAISNITNAILATPSVTTNDLVTMLELAKCGHGIAILPDEFQPPKGSQVELRRLFTVKALSANQLWLFTHTESRKLKHVSSVARALADALKQRFSE